MGCEPELFLSSIAFGNLRLCTLIWDRQKTRVHLIMLHSTLKGFLTKLKNTPIKPRVDEKYASEA